MKGERIPASAHCQVRLDFLRSSVPLQARDRAFLEQELDAYVAWGRRENVPLYPGEPDPRQANTALIELFRQKLRSPAVPAPETQRRAFPSALSD